jgi:hypothetical protein
VAALGLLLVAQSAVAAGEKPGKPADSEDEKRIGIVVGGLAGINMVVEGAVETTPIGFGVSAGYSLSPTWTIGGMFTTANTTVDTTAPGAPTAAPLTRTSTLSLFTTNFEFHLPKGIKGLYFNARAGVAVRNASFGAPDPGAFTANYLTVGGGAGYDYPVLDAMTIGVLVNYLAAFTPVLTNDLQGFLSIRYWF